MPARSVSCAISGENGAFSTSLIGQRIDHLDAVERGKLGLAERGRQREVPVEREFRGLGIERLAVVELDARPQLDRHLLAVGGGLMGQRELRHEVELLVDVEQLVAERGEHDAPDIGARRGRVENVRILGKADAQRGLRVHAASNDSSSAAAATAKRKIFIAPSPSRSLSVGEVLTISTPARPAPSAPCRRPRPIFPATTKSRRPSGTMVSGWRQFRHAVAGRGVAVASATSCGTSVRQRSIA